MVRQSVLAAFLGRVSASDICADFSDEASMIQTKNRHEQIQMKTVSTQLMETPEVDSGFVDLFDADNNVCPSGYFLRTGWKLGTSGGCDGSPRNNYCILPTEDVMQVCNADSDCTGISWTTNLGWREAFPGKAEIGGGSPYGNHGQWHSCVKNVLDPPNNVCPFGYTYQEGLLLGKFGGCPNSPRSTTCLLPTESATQFCEANPACTGISYTRNTGWTGAFPGLVALGGGAPDTNLAHGQWFSCTKNIDPEEFLDESELSPGEESSAGDLTHLGEPDFGEELDLFNNVCPSGYFLRAGWKLGTSGGCEGSVRSNYCILPTESITQVCGADPDCTGISWTTNPGWRGAFPGRAELGGGSPYGNHGQWHSCVKNVLDPDNNLCPYGYTYQEGLLLGKFGGCPNSPRSKACLLPTESATQFCEANPACTGISYTRNTGWTGAFPGLVALGGGAPDTNLAHGQWFSCTKNIDPEEFLDEIEA